MARLILIGTTIILAIMTVVGFTIKSQPKSTITQRMIRPIPIQVEPIQPIIEIPTVIQEINLKNSQISTFSCDNVYVKAWEKGMRFHLTGKLNYQKATNFRTKLESRFGTELEMGSNDKVFWYWSKRDKHPGLYYAIYEDYHKTRLKTPFNPIFMRQSLGLDEITISDSSQVLESESDIVIIYERKNSIGSPILFSIFVDKASKNINGVMITDTSKKPLASAEVQEYTASGLPSQILYMWYEENKAVQFTFENPRINVEISAEKWALPDRAPRIDMAEELVLFHD
jgi:hypothetical protein